MLEGFLGALRAMSSFQHDPSAPVGRRPVRRLEHHDGDDRLVEQVIGGFGGGHRRGGVGEEHSEPATMLRIVEIGRDELADGPARAGQLQVIAVECDRAGRAGQLVARRPAAARQLSSISTRTEPNSSTRWASSSVWRWGPWSGLLR